ncbi:MAG TPA: hypothetical protein DCG42_17410 [Maribacter sp.]|uniref:hypothetical protein n=1 Tax=unclassified Maribacter TaxID=2615042 RepID=UPI000EE66232|nr:MULTISPECIES: hypothetical protein [unclassified Maribacter]HAF79090.1 hypothetical protein [Maribacter sp.]HAI41344.1 hypothetical protein [Maribacter sp.]|tara:strand:- start:61 stop:462 length:402 start_codon:yes stop_codon:yes gene_type:complete
METTNLKNTFLLGASLNILHQESREWMDAVEFWKDETRFFENLLHKKKPLDEDKALHAQLILSLKNVSLDLLDELEDDVKDHEKLLARLMKEEKGISDWEYRESHSKLKKRINKVQQDFNSFKKLVFTYVKSL